MALPALAGSQTSLLTWPVAREATLTFALSGPALEEQDHLGQVILPQQLSSLKMKWLDLAL